MLREIPVTLDMLRTISDEVTGDENYLPSEELFSGPTINGKGKIRFKNGNQYTGDIQNGIIEGEGQFVWSDGVSYRGTFVCNTMKGKGRYEWPDGSVYEGDIRDGLREGRGTFITSVNKETLSYDGEWKNGLKHGHGVMKYSGSGYA